MYTERYGRKSICGVTVDCDIDNFDILCNFMCGSHACVYISCEIIVQP